MTEAPHVFLQATYEVDGKVATGIAAEGLLPKWFDKTPDKSAEREIEEMLLVIRRAVATARLLPPGTAFEFWRGLYDAQMPWAAGAALPPLLAHFGVSMVERTALDALARANAVDFATLLRRNLGGIRLGEIHPELAGREPTDFLPARPLPRIIARHTVGLSDPLTAADVAPGDRLDDGLPRTLEEQEMLHHLRELAKVIPIFGFYLLTGVGGIALPYGFWREVVEIENDGPGATPDDTAPTPRGEYANSCVARERVFQYFSEKTASPGRLVRLNYAIDCRYGALHDVAMRVMRGTPIDIRTGVANCIWQGDAISHILRCLLKPTHYDEREGVFSVMNVQQVQNYIGGQWVDPAAGPSVPVHNPSTGEVIARTPLSPAGEVDRAAAEAFPAWRETPVLRRAAILFRFKALLEQRFDEVTALITRENGKTLEESRGDLRRGIEVVEFACGIPHLVKGETLPQVSAAIDGASTFEPLGVCAGITPFNFPAMVPMWMFPLAIACGNCFVLKPSEKVPLTANRLGELFGEAGLPPGVFNVVHGGREAVEALCTHPGVAAVSFVGSSAVAQRVYELGCGSGKRVQAAGGAKNVMLVMPDADPESTIRAVMGAAFGCAGQRCMAGSVVMGVGEAGQGVVDRLRAAANALRVQPTDSQPQSQMGPVIDGAARDRLFGIIARAAEEGAQVVRDGRRQVPDAGFFVGPTLIDHVTPDMALARTELFGPVLAIGRPASIDTAIEWINAGGYGNGAVIFTRNGGTAREFARRVQCGMVGVNVGVPAPMAVFSFSGWNRSFFGDLHVQGTEGVRFYTRQKVVFSRWDNAYERTMGW